MRCGGTDSHHCSHFTGETFDTGTEGFATAKCCKCGQRVQVEYRIKSLPLPGHGPHVTRRNRIFDMPEGWEIAAP